ncbi:MAG: methyltransferase domain-containing protein [Verrucomicrobia bacterium]|nr:methyltransferase domain-containing protein [Verrucomicrobiota bacterium]MDA1005297.1 methyltransferase domain-containing protein [Verrucomicrobiota bacterium]
MASEGSRWLERFLLPLLEDLLADVEHEPVRRCLQLQPDNEEEALHLRGKGWICDLLVEEGTDLSHLAGTPTVLPQNLEDMTLSDASYDLVFSGQLGPLLKDSRSRARRIGELARVCKPGGGILAVFGNRLCPLDLTHSAPILHGPGASSLATMTSLRRDFVESGAFSSLRPLSVNGHFSSTGAAGPRRVLRAFLEWNWRHFVKPEREWAYASVFNPVLLVWIQK